MSRKTDSLDQCVHCKRWQMSQVQVVTEFGFEPFVICDNPECHAYKLLQAY